MIEKLGIERLGTWHKGGVWSERSKNDPLLPVRRADIPPIKKGRRWAGPRIVR
jgi:hypothetical protein